MDHNDTYLKSRLVNAGRYFQYVAITLGGILISNIIFFDMFKDAENISELLDMVKSFVGVLWVLILICLGLIYVSGQELIKAGTMIGQGKITGVDQTVLDKNNIQQSEGEIDGDSSRFTEIKTDKGVLKFYIKNASGTPMPGDEVRVNGVLVEDGKYKLGFMWYAVIRDGRVVDITPF